MLWSSRILRTLAVCAGLLLISAAPVLGQRVRIIDIELPYALPFYAGDELADLVGEDGLYEHAMLSRYFYRPMDDLTPRPGARATGMGSAYLSLAEGPMAMGWNPAGMTSLQEATISVDGFLVSSSGNVTESLPDSILMEGQPDFGIQSYDDRLGNIASFGFAGIAAPLFRIKSRPLVGGIAYRRHTDVAFGNEAIIEMGLLAGTGFPFVLGSDDSEMGSIYSFTLGLACDAVDFDFLTLSLGGTANFMRGRLRSETQTRVNVRGYGEGNHTFQRDYRGFSVELGLLARVAEMVQLGGWVGLPHDLKAYNSKFSSLPLATPNDEVVYRISGRIADFNLRMPLFASAGISVGPIKGIRLSADINYRPWSDVDIKYDDDIHLVYDDSTYQYSSFDCAYPSDDVISYHVGGTFEFPFFRDAFHRAGLTFLAQGGYRTMPLSMYNMDLVSGEAPYYEGDQVEGSAFGFGFSLETEARIDFHVGMEFQSYEFRKWFLDDARDLEYRALGFNDPWSQVIPVNRSVTIFRFSSQIRL